MISGKDTGAVIARYGERREHCPVADFQVSDRRDAGGP